MNRDNTDEPLEEEPSYTDLYPSLDDEDLDDIADLLDLEGLDSYDQRELNYLVDPLATIEDAEACEVPATVFDEDEDEKACEVPTTAFDEDENESNLPSTLLEVDALECENHQQAATSIQNRFWIYGTQGKGPKSKAFNVKVSLPESPHDPLIYRDPAFDKANRSQISHTESFRTGQGNDIEPKPKLLHKLGQDLAKAEEEIAKSKKRASQKISSRVARLRQQARHEANKIIFHGLEKERAELSKAIKSLQTTVAAQDPEVKLTDVYQTQTASITPVAGRHDDYVSEVLEEFNRKP